MRFKRGGPGSCIGHFQPHEVTVCVLLTPALRSQCKPHRKRAFARDQLCTPLKKSGDAHGMLAHSDLGWLMFGCLLGRLASGEVATSQ